MTTNTNDGKERLIIISNYAPDEIYLSKEVRFLKEKYSVVLFRKKDRSYRNIRVKSEKGVEVVEIPTLTPNSLFFFVHLFLALFRKETIQEFIKLLRKRKLSIRNLKKIFWIKVISHFDSSYIIKTIFQKGIDASAAIIYTYRLNSGALTAINLKNKFNGKKCIGRAHGIDLYEYRDCGDYLPFRQYMMKNLDEIYTISVDGLNYLVNRYYFVSDKVRLARLGTVDYGIEIFDSGKELSIISCSRVESIKRLDRIVLALSKITDVAIRWTHIGDGSQFQEIKSLAECILPYNIKTYFTGNIENNEIYKIYKENYFDIFINVSYDEGLPVAIMEASSFGIPVIATDVGGTSEIVENGYNGWLIPRDYDDSILCELLLAYHRMEDNDKQIVRENARCKWEEGFNQEINYRKFVDMISVTESSRKTN